MARRKMSENGPHSLVVVVNTGDHAVTLRHTRLGDLTLAPGKKRTVPIEVALVNLGNPEANDRGKVRERSDEFKRIQRKWGFNKGFYSEDAWFGVGVETALGTPVGPYCPPIEVYDPDTNERLYFIHDDPHGVQSGHATAGRIQLGSDESMLTQQVAALQRQITLLGDQLAAQQASSTAPRAFFEGQSDQTDPDDKTAALAATPELDEAFAKAAATAATAAKGQTQAERNEARDEIPMPAEDEPPVGKDKPSTGRIGRGGR
jgi:hypothetical protein